MNKERYTPHDGKIEGKSPKIDRAHMLEMVKNLQEDGIIDLQDMTDPRVKEVYDQFILWTREGEANTDGEDRLKFYLEQNMLMFDAGLINEEKGLREVDAGLVEQLHQAQDSDNRFTELAAQIEVYRKKIAMKLAQLGRTDKKEKHVA